MRYLVVLLMGLALSACVTTNEDGAIISQPKPNLKEAARINTQLGVDYMRRGNNEFAMEKLTRALQQDPGLAQAHSAIAVLYSRLGENEEAESHYRRALSLDGSGVNIRNNFGTFLCTSGREKEAFHYFEEAANERNNPSPERAWINAGLCAKRIPDLEKADAYFRKALQIQPNQTDALIQLAWIAYEQKEFLSARGFVQRYERSGPVTPEILWIAGRVEAALGDNAAALGYQGRLQREFPEFKEPTPPSLQNNPPL